MSRSTANSHKRATGAAAVTGVAGFIGSHVAEALVRTGARVVGVDNLDDFYSRDLKRANVDAVRQADGANGCFRFVEADVRDAHALRAALADDPPDTIIHLAARAGVRPSIERPALYADVNIAGTMRALEIASELGCKRVLIASSSSVYGDAAQTPFREGDACAQPISPYAATKRACELFAHAHHHLHGLSIACLRFFTVFGPRQRPDLAIARFMRLAAAGQPIPMFGDGATSRDYTYIDDIVAGVLAAVSAIDAHGFRIWNLGGSNPVSLRDMIDAVRRVTGKPVRVEQHPMQPGDVRCTFADLTRSGRELGFAPTTRFEDGLAKQWRWTKRRAADSAASPIATPG